MQAVVLVAYADFTSPADFVLEKNQVKKKVSIYFSVEMEVSQKRSICKLLLPSTKVSRNF